MEERVPGTGDVWGFYESRRLVPLIPSRPRKPCPSFLWEAGRRYIGLPALLQCSVGAMVSQHAVAWMDSSRTLTRCELEERAHCRLPTGSPYGPPAHVLQPAGSRTISRSRGVQRTRVLHRVHPVWSSPHCDSQGPHPLPTRVVL